jgi:hypothetical protein
VPRRRRPLVVARSGLDRAGTSAQAVALRDALEDHGVRAAVVHAAPSSEGRPVGTWARLVLVAEHVRAHRRALRNAGTDVVVCDYVLDVVAALRSAAGDDPHRLDVLLLQRLSPAPSVAWHLDAPPASSEAGPLATCYRIASVELGIEALDGGGPLGARTDAMAAEVLTHAQRRTPGRPGPRGPAPTSR